LKAEKFLDCLSILLLLLGFHQSQILAIMSEEKNEDIQPPPSSADAGEGDEGGEKTLSKSQLKKLAKGKVRCIVSV
jgi:hypothetical protein